MTKQDIQFTIFILIWLIAIILAFLITRRGDAGLWVNGLFIVLLVGWTVVKSVKESWK